MKGKIAFVFGAAAGYVLGTRAGRARYEQIKSGAQTVWNSAPVQRQVDAAKAATIGKLSSLGLSAVKAGKSAVTSRVKGAAQKSTAQAPAASASTDSASGAS